MLLKISEIHKSFGEKQVLRGISFEAQTGKALGLLGRNGAGKTTAIRIIMDVFPPDSGNVTIDGKPLSRSDLRLGYLPEERGLYPKRQILEQLVYFGRLRGMNRSDAEQSARGWLTRMGMSDTAGALLNTLSKGNQQKIQLAAALVHDPHIVILDEPFSGLDPVNSQLLKEMVGELIEKGKIVLFSSHQMSYVERFCDSVAMLHEGKIVLFGDLRSIKRSYPRNDIFISTDENGPLAAQVLTEIESGENPPWLKSWEKAPGGAVVRLTAPDAKDALLSAILAKNASLERFEVLEPSLEQIFIEKAGDSE